MASYHPSALLRAPDPAAREKMERELVADLRLTRERLEQPH
jgi:uracil-DNA glycosylase